MKRRAHNKLKMNVVSVWITVIFTVIAITLVALFITVYATLMQNELHYTLRDQAAQLTDNADTQLVTDLQYQALQRIASYEEARDLILSVAHSPAQDAADIHALSACCAEINAYLRQTDRLEFYFPAQQMLVGSHGVSFLADKKYAVTPASCVDWAAIYPSEFRHFRYGPIGEDDTYFISFARMYPGIFPEGHQPMMILSIEESHFHTLLRQSLRTLDSDDFILLADTQGVIISAQDASLIGTTLPESVSALRASTLANGQSAMLVENLSATGEWMYVLAHANPVSLLSHIPLVSAWAFLCVAMLVIGLVLVLSLLMKHYAHPMDRLMQHFPLADSAGKGKFISSPRDHFLQMESALSDMNKARQDQEEFFTSNRQLLRTSWLNCFVRGEANYLAPQPHLHINFPHPHFQVVIASPNPTPEMLDEILAAFDPQFVVAAFESPEREIVMLVNHALDEAALPAQLEIIAQQTDPSGTLVFGVGILARTEDLVPASFRCARRALASRFFEKQQRVSVFDPSTPHTEAESALTQVLSQLTNLTALIRRQSEADVNQAIDSIINQLKESCPYPNIMRSIMLLSAMFLSKVVYDMHGSPESVYGENLMEAYYRIEGISAFSSRLKRDSACLSAYLSQESSPVNRSVVQYAIHHIRSTPPSELFIQSIANALNISTGHLSRVFHQETGRKLIDYLQEVRMEHAARLLSEGEMTNEEICEYVGYSRPQYFSTKFKDHFGLTPNEYRRQHTSSNR